MKFKANQSDFDALRDALLQKADKSEVKKDIKHIDAMIEELR